MGTTADKGAYLNTTKSLLKDKINNLGGEITDETTFRQYANQLQNVYDNLPKTEYQEGTEITLSNTLKGKLDFEDGIVGFGQAKQETTQGYNLVDISSGTTSSLVGVSTSISGDIVTLNGSRTDGSTSNAVRIINEINKFNISSSDTYKMTLNVISGTYTGRVGLTFLNSSGTTLAYIETATDGTTASKSLTFSEQISKISFFFNGDFSANNFKFQIMLQKGTSIINYEKYTGGQASPSPNWEQEIKCVAGRNKLPTYEIKKFTASADAWCSLDGISNFYNQTNIAPSKVFCILKANQTYTISVYQKANTNNVQLVDYTGAVLLTGLETQAKQYTPSTDIKVYPRLKVTNSNTETYCYMQIEEGSQATSYLPYNTIEEVVSGKNLYSGEVELGAINGSNGQPEANLTVIRTPNYINVQQVRKIAIVGNDNVSRVKVLCTYNSSKQYLGNSTISNNNVFDIDTITISNQTIYYHSNSDIAYIKFVVTGTTDTSILYGVINNSTTYEPYITPTSYQLSLGEHEFNAIGDYKDELIYDVENDKVYKNEKIGKKIFTGASDENWAIWQGIILIDDTTIKNLGTSNSNFYLNYFRSVLSIAYIGSNTGQRLHIQLSNAGLSEITSVSAWKTWLSTHNLEFVYVCNETLTEITDPTLKAQVKAWYNAHSNNGTTIITSNGNLPMIIKVRGLKGE